MKLQNHTLIKGTIILTITGFITRIIGFIYKIYLADLLGAKMLGIYQLVFPIYGICFTIYGAGIQTAISQVIASQTARKEKGASPGKVLAVGTAIALSLAVSLSFLVYFQSDWIALHLVLEPSLSPYLKIISFMFPFCCTTACINGYYYGVSQARVPAITQIVEQIMRVAFVVFFCMTVTVTGVISCQIAVWGLVVGEVSSCVYNLWKLSREKRNKRALAFGTSEKAFLKPLLWLSLTLTATKLIVSILHSTETVLIPAALRKFGCSVDEALSIYGILTGMSMSFIFFPSTITNSFAVMLLPNIANAHACGNEAKIKQAVTFSVKYCLLIGILCTCIFIVFGNDFGTIFFHNQDAGSYLTVLSWLCPFLYLGTTLTSIINGMGKTPVTFCYTMISLIVKILFLILAVPFFGIRGYLVGLLVSQLLLTLLESLYLSRYIQLNAVEWILIPGIFLLVAGYFSQALFHVFQSNLSSFVSLALSCSILCISYLALLLLKGIISRKDFSINR